LFHAKWHQDADRQQTHDVDNRSEARVCGEHPPRAHPAECDDCSEEALHGRSVPPQTSDFKNNQSTFVVVMVTLVLALGGLTFRGRLLLKYHPSHSPCSEDPVHPIWVAHFTALGSAR